MKHASDDFANEESRELARQENGKFWKFVCSFLLSCVYGVIGFFAFWKFKDVGVFLLNRWFGDPMQHSSRLFTVIVTIAGALGWFISFVLLWHALYRDDLTVKQRALRFVIYCAAAAAVWLGFGLVYRYFI